MKTRVLVSIIITIIIGLLLISGCATTGKMKEPAKADSTLLIGRIKLVCENFPKRWHINGEHTKDLRIYFADPETKKTVIVKSKGDDGIFYLLNPTASQFVIIGFEIKKKGGNMIFNNHHLINNTYINITKNSVNNLGDIIWAETFTEEEKRGGGSSSFSRIGEHTFRSNYDEVESWFKDTFTESSWKRIGSMLNT